MSKNDIDTNLVENYMKKEIQTQIKNSEEINKDLIFDNNLQNYYMQNHLYDYIYPFCIFFQTNEKIPNLDIHFRMNYRYLYKLR